jgi:iron complex transport system substrate-binding protein
VNRTSLALLTAAALVVASCGGDDDDDAAAVSTAAAPETTAAAPATTAAAAGDDEDAAVAAFTAVFDSDVPFADKAAHLENADSLQAAAEAYAGAGSAMGGITLEPTNVAIEGDTATVTYDVLFGGAPAYQDLSKTITRTGGVWIVPQAAFCEFLTSARVTCP